MITTLEIIQFFHFLIDIITTTYIFIFNPYYDIYYSLFLFLQTSHWPLIKDECIISYFEKKIIDPNYEMGSNASYCPHYEIYHNEITLLLKSLLIIITLLIIIYRSESEFIAIISSTSIVIWLYYTFPSMPSFPNLL
jgi:hypothetical protein